MATETKDVANLRHETPVKDLMRQSQLEKLASTPAPAVKKKYDVMPKSCGGHKWRREILPGGGFGPWEDMGPAK